MRITDAQARLVPPQPRHPLLAMTGEPSQAGASTR
jgi:hypothetical protein